jgi:hypothetical protein
LLDDGLVEVAALLSVLALVVLAQQVLHKMHR